MDRDRLADIIYLVRDLEGFHGVHERNGRVHVAIDSERGRVRAASRLTVLNGVDVEIVMRAHDPGRGLEVTQAELDAAEKRDAARRQEWVKYQFHVNDKVKRAGSQYTRAVLVVSSAARRYADALVALSIAPLHAYGTSEVAHVLDMLAVYRRPNVIVLDASLEGTSQLHERIRKEHPTRFSEFSSVQWIAGSEGLLDTDVDRILAALHTRRRHIENPVSPFAHLQILVVDAPHGKLEKEVTEVTPGATIHGVDGWTALERLDAESFDLVIASDAGEVGLPSLVRFVKGCEPAPPIVIAQEAPTSKRMRGAFPRIAHYFVDRPLHTADLASALRRASSSS